MSDILISILAPLFTFLATKFVTWIKGNIPSWVITTVLVPMFSGISAYLASLVGTELSWYVIALISASATFFYEAWKNLTGK